MQSLVNEFGVTTLVLIALAAIITSSIHGAIGVAGGILMTAALALLIGVKPSVPVMSIALIISHGARSLMNLPDINFRVYRTIMLASVPFIAMSSYLYVELPVNTVAWVLAIVILTSVPIRHWAKSRKIKAGHGTLAVAGVGYGTLAGVSVGSGQLLIPFLLGYGLTKEAFVATMAFIALSTNIVRISVFGSTDIMTSDYALLGLLTGILMIPGTWIGRNLLRRMANQTHDRLIDGFAILGGLNFLYLAIFG